MIVLDHVIKTFSNTSTDCMPHSTAWVDTPINIQPCLVDVSELSLVQWPRPTFSYQQLKLLGTAHDQWAWESRHWGQSWTDRRHRLLVNFNRLSEASKNRSVLPRIQYCLFHTSSLCVHRSLKSSRARAHDCRASQHVWLNMMWAESIIRATRGLINGVAKQSKTVQNACYSRIARFRQFWVPI